MSCMAFEPHGNTVKGTGDHTASDESNIRGERLYDDTDTAGHDMLESRHSQQFFWHMCCAKHLACTTCCGAEGKLTRWRQTVCAMP